MWRELVIATRGAASPGRRVDTGRDPGLAAAAAYGVALWRVPGWMHATTAQDRYDARVLVISVGGAIVVGTGLLYTARGYRLPATGYRLSRRGQVTDRFTVALERLGSAELYVRIGGVHALEHVMRDSAEHHNDVIEVLTEFIRDRAPRSDRQPGRQVWMYLVTGSVPDLPTRPAPDIQAPRPHWATGRTAQNDNIDLAGLHLVGANLTGASLTGAWLGGADLTGAGLDHANLTHAGLGHTDLTDASLGYANLTGVSGRQRSWSRGAGNETPTGG